MTARRNPLAAALAGHLVGDWIVQTDRQAAGKQTSWAANQEHMIGYHAAMAIALSGSMPAGRVAALIAVSWSTHSIIDRRWPVQKLMQVTGSRPFADTAWGPMCVDQALHLAILAICIDRFGAA